MRLGSGLQSLPSNLFQYCPLTDVYVSWTTPAGLEIPNETFPNVHKITLHVPLGCTRNYETRSPWNNFREIVEYVPGGNEGKEKCQKPSIAVESNALRFTSATPGAKFYYTIACDDQTPLTSNETGIVPLTATCRIAVYAYADGYDNSETLNALLVWTNPKSAGEYDPSSILSVEQKRAIVVRSDSRGITLTGTERGEQVSLYNIGGVRITTTNASDGETCLTANLKKGEVYIVKVGETTFKVKI